MATLNKRGTTVLLEVCGDRGTRYWALRSDAHILKRRPTGGLTDAGRVKPDLTIGFIRAWAIKRWPDATVRATVGDDYVPNPLAKHTALVAAQATRAAKAKAEADHERADESFLLSDLPMEADPTPIAHEIVAYCVRTLRGRSTGFGGCTRPGRVHDRRLRYVADMARFHGSRSGWLGTAVMANMVLPRDYAHRPALDAMAEAVARAVYGSDQHAARAWARALG